METLINENKIQLFKWIRLLAIVMLLIALVKLPYGYYVLLRWVLCTVFVYIGVHLYKQKNEIWFFILLLLTVIYNPFITLRLGYLIQTIVNSITIIIIALSFKFMKFD